MSTIDDTSTPAEPAWLQAGRAWEHAATDWAYLFEPYARDAIETVFRAAGVGPGTDLVDVACGSGLALSRAERLGATVAGIDAAPGLIEIARRRTASVDVVAGDMFDLPWSDGAFDVATSFNGIWGGCQAAVAEMARVVAPGGLVAITFWGRSDHLDLRDFFIALGTARTEVAEELIELAQIGADGVAEAMFDGAGIDVVERGTTEARLELADDDLAWRALRSPGVVKPTLDALGEDEMRTRLMAAVAPFRSEAGTYLITNELVHVIGRRR